MRSNSPKQSKPAPHSPFKMASKDLPATQGMLHLVRNELKHEMKAGFSEVNSKLERVLSEVARVGVLVEEQHSKNRITLEGLTGLWQRQERIETRVDEVEKTVRSIARSRT